MSTLDLAGVVTTSVVIMATLIAHIWREYMAPA